MTLALGMAATTASAQESLDRGALFSASGKARSIFDVEPIAAAGQAGTVTTTTPHDHQFGGGLRIGGLAFGVGGSVRYFFLGGPLGVQGEVTHYKLNLGNREWSSLQISPAVIYRFVEQKLDAPISLTPYAGGGLSFFNADFDDEDVFFEEVLGLDDSNVGVFVFGGVEIFFERVPNLGVSGELSFNSNDDISTTTVGAAFTGAAHWYFW